MAKLVEDDMSLANNSLENLRPIIESILDLKKAMTKFRENSPEYLSGADFDVLFKKYDEMEGHLKNMALDINTIIGNSEKANQTLQAYIDRKPAELAACEVTEIDNSKLGELQIRLEDAERKLESAKAKMDEYKSKMYEINSVLRDESITDPDYRASLSADLENYSNLYQSAKGDCDYYSEKIEQLNVAIDYLKELQPTDDTAYSQITSSQTTFTWF